MNTVKQNLQNILTLNKVLKQTIVILTLLIFFSLNVYASSNMNVIISSQTPDPVKPGNFVDISIKITNQGSSSIQDAQIEVVENRFISLSANQNRITRVGAIPAYSSQTDGFVIVRKRLYIDETAPIGEQLIEIRVRGNNNDFTVNLPIFIQENKPSLNINVEGSLEDVTYYPGELKPFTINLFNDNEIQLRNIKINLQVSQNENINPAQATLSQTSNFFITQGTNSQRIRNLASQESSQVTFNLGVSPNAQIRPYQIPLTIEYEDVLGNSFIEEVELSIIVNAKENLLISLDRLDRNQVVFGIANPGPGLVRGGVVTFLNLNNEVLGTEYIGNLNADDFQTVQFSTPSSNNVDDSLASSQDVKVKVEFGDGFFNQKVVEEQFTLKLPQRVQEGSSTVWIIIIILILIGGVYYFKIRKKKGDDE
ncbi:MAG: hypothetical protein LAT82_00530 [Nanoarchaeota archaeon]|nr:hypothetical protein [Nanoarchaeota archaeon]